MKTHKRHLRYLVCLFVALLTALGFAWFAKLTSQKNGIWIANWLVGSQDSNIYIRAFIALNGLVAFNKNRFIDLNVTDDEEGQPLNSRCNYVLIGGDIEARWWSIAAYGSDRFLIPNQAIAIPIPAGNC